MADNNLTVDITVKTQNARDEIELLSAKIRGVRKEVRALADETTKDPTALPKFKATNAELTKLEQNLVKVQKAARSVRVETENAGGGFRHLTHETHSIERLVNTFTNMSKAAETTSGLLGTLALGFRGGIAGVAAYKGFELLKDTINELSKSLTELKTAAGEIAIRPIALQGAQRAVQGIGEEADVATKMLSGMNAQLEELRQHPPVPGSSPGAGGAFGTAVFRGGQPDVSDFSHPLRALGIEGQISGLLQSRRPDASLQAQMLALRSFVQQQRRFDPQQLNLLSKSLFQGQPASTTLESAQAVIENLQKEIDKLKTSEAGATEQAIEDNKKLIISQNAVTTAIKETAASWANFFRPAEVAFNQLITKSLDAGAFSITKHVEAWKEAGRTIAEFLGRILPQGSRSQEGQVIPIAPKVTLPDVNVSGGGNPPAVYRGPGRGVDDQHGPPYTAEGHGPGSRPTQSITPGVSDYQAPPRGAFVEPTLQFSAAQVEATKASLTAADHIAALGSAADAAARSVNAWIQSASPTGFAGGGLVSGPGTGTSDSILARLSAGEFVINAARVRELGTGLLSRLNGYARGGLVGVPRFADGGLVATASGGTPVHLHLDGQSFQTTASESVASALVVAARRQQMRSAGIKPSWYGAARPGA
jgi:hypothetical protein